MKYKKIAQNFLHYVKNNCKLRTYVVYDTLYQTHIKDVFADRKVNDIKNEDWTALFNEKAKTLSNGSLKVIKSLIKSIYKHSNIECKIDVKLPNSKQKTKQIEALTKREQKEIERYIVNRRDCYKYGILISLYTGIRIGELLALTWEDIDLKRQTINISKTVYSISRNNQTITYTDTPKTESSNRIIALPKCLISIFKELKTYQHNKSKFVISKDNGKQIGVRAYQQSFNALLKRLKLKHYGFHSLRHTFATRAIENGCDIKTLSEILGHSNITITLQSYVHSSLEQKSHLMNKVGKMLAS